MAIITFCSNELKETGQSISVAAIATHMAITHNYKILIVPTNFNDLTVENCFWEYNKIRPTGAIEANSTTVGIDSGIEGLIKVLASNRTSTEIVKNYSRIVLKDRLDVLLSPATNSYQEYMKITPNYPTILSTANRYYDLVFVDLGKKMPKQDASNILQMSDIVTVNLMQNLKTLDDFISLKEKNEFYQRKNVMLAMGKYDETSKYNKNNVTRYLKEKKALSVVPYNTLLLEAASEGGIIDFFLKIRNITDQTDTNIIFAKDLTEATENIIFKLQELQMKL